MNSAITNHHERAANAQKTKAIFRRMGLLRAPDLPRGAGGPLQWPGSGSESRTPSHFCPGTADFSVAKYGELRKIFS